MSEQAPRHAQLPEEPGPQQYEPPIDPEAVPTIPDLPESFAIPEAPDQPLTPEQQQEAETRLADVKILHKSFQVRIAIDRNVTSALNKIQEKRGEWRNKLSAPKHMYLEGRYEAAEDKYQRKAGKVGTSRIGLINKLHQRNANVQKTKRDKAAEKLNAHTTKMEGRLKSSEQSISNNNRLHRRKIEMYKDRKSIAEGRKELRKIRREMLDNGKSRMEVTRALQRVTPDQMKQLGVIACTREHAVRGSKHLEKQQRKAEKQEAKLGNELSQTMEFAEDRHESLERAKKSIGEFEDVANKARDKVASLQAKHDELPEGSEERAKAEAEITEAQGHAERVEAMLQRQKERVADLEDQIIHLSKQIEEQRTKVRQHSETVASLNRQDTERKARLEQLNAQAAAELSSMHQPQQAPVTRPVAPYPTDTTQPVNTEPIERNQP